MLTITPFPCALSKTQKNYFLCSTYLIIFLYDPMPLKASLNLAQYLSMCQYLLLLKQLELIYFMLLCPFINFFLIVLGT